VFKNFITASLALLASLPTLVGTVMGLVAASEKTGFMDSHPVHHQKLVNLVKEILAFLVDHWFIYGVTCMVIGLFWALIVTEAKTRSRQQFDSRRKGRIGKVP
jgi:hypothetical protein